MARSALRFEVSDRGRQFVRRAILVTEIFARSLIVLESFGLGVPFEVGLRLVSDVAEQRGRCAAVTGLDVTMAPFAATYAIEEVARVISVLRPALYFLRCYHRPLARAPAALNCAVERRADGKFVRRDVVGDDLVAVVHQVESAFRSAKFDVAIARAGQRRAGVDLCETDERAAPLTVLILPDDFERVRDFAIVFDGEIAAHRGHRHRPVLAERPMNRVQIWNAHVRELAAGITVKPAEAVEGAVLVVRDFGRRAEPSLPVEIGGRRFVRRFADAFGPFVLNVEGARVGDLADAAASNELDGLAAVIRRTPLQADLHYALMPLGRLDHPAALCDRERKRLLDIDVLASLTGVNHLQRVPVVRRGDDHCVHVFHLQQLPIVLELSRATADLLRGEIHVRLMNVADGDDLGVFVLEETVQHLVAAIANRDAAETNAVIRSQHTPTAERRADGSRRRDFSKVSASQFAHSRSLLA